MDAWGCLAFARRASEVCRNSWTGGLWAVQQRCAAAQSVTLEVYVLLLISHSTAAGVYAQRTAAAPL